MIEEFNTSEKAQYSRHKKYGVIVRKRAKKYFVQSDVKFATAFWEYVEPSEISENMIKIEHYKRNKPEFVRCVTCSDKKGADVMYPRKEIDIQSGKCRSCFVGYDNPYEKAQLNIMNAFYKVGHSPVQYNASRNCLND